MFMFIFIFLFTLPSPLHHPSSLLTTHPSPTNHSPTHPQPEPEPQPQPQKNKSKTRPESIQYNTQKRKGQAGGRTMAGTGVWHDMAMLGSKASEIQAGMRCVALRCMARFSNVSLSYRTACVRAGVGGDTGRGEIGDRRYSSVVGEREINT